jgi:hypothetical protein
MKQNEDVWDDSELMNAYQTAIDSYWVRLAPFSLPARVFLHSGPNSGAHHWCEHLILRTQHFISVTISN